MVGFSGIISSAVNQNDLVGRIPLGVFIGAVMAPDEGNDFLSLYKKADQVLYQVKKNGKHGYIMMYRQKNVDVHDNFYLFVLYLEIENTKKKHLNLHSINVN